ncbi:MAG: polyphosphate kinase [Candidatus Rokubacteria bacterium 13_1_40CM_2_68_8]|nr:MAG: polyphosphate kinase [Gemmatimonadetes bacterium 13_1_40CM_70_15]OLD37367.1 MAG: polyphosphate kinase [Candidatus Rokubacteria bacterium 13_1_40CM_2_68_8]
MKLWEQLIVPSGRHVQLAKWDPDDTVGHKKGAATEDALTQGIARLDELQYVMYADQRHALLVVLQGMDAAGKDGTIRHVMSGFNPQGCHVTAFKRPSAEEAAHDFLWRVHRAVPARGDIAIFNRSHYEDVLVARVRQLVPRDVWSQRYDQINRFEALLAENGVTVVKFFLHISKEEQKRRFEERLKDPTKQWKLAPEDFDDRKYWDDYAAAYEDVLGRCSTDVAPWFVIPANKKWFRNLAVSRILVHTLERLDLKFPKPSFDVSRLTVV